MDLHVRGNGVACLPVERCRGSAATLFFLVLLIYRWLSEHERAPEMLKNAMGRPPPSTLHLHQPPSLSHSSKEKQTHEEKGGMQHQTHQQCRRVWKKKVLVGQIKKKRKMVSKETECSSWQRLFFATARPVHRLPTPMLVSTTESP